MSEEIKTLKDINLKEDRLYTGSREFAKDVLIPGLKVASKLDITTGYFSSKSLVLLSKGLYTFLKREKKVRILMGLGGISFSKDVLEATVHEKNQELIDAFKEQLLEDVKLFQTQLEKDRVAVLAYLMIEGLLTVKLGEVNGTGELHAKSYHLEDDDKNLITANGSANSTEKGLWANWEQMTVHTNSDPSPTAQSLNYVFNQNWNNENYDLTSYILDENFAKELLEQIGSPDKEELLKRASQEDTIENDISKYLQDSPIYLDYNVGRVGLHPHQSKSFQQSIEKWPIRQLYADEVGLGKTIEMGSTISYLVKNHLVDSVLILAPPNICKQLQQQMLNLFDLNFYRLETTSRKLLSLEQNSNIIKLDKDITYDSKIFPKLTIISQGLARGTSKNNIFKNCNNYPDLLVVDEAHGARKYPVRSSTSETIFRELLMQIKPKVKHIILATATPMRASVDEYYYLLEILGIDEYIDISQYRKILNIISRNSITNIRESREAIQLLKSTFLPFKNYYQELMPKDLYSKIEILTTEKLTIEQLTNKENRKSLFEALILTNPTRIFTSRNTRELLEQYPSIYKFPKRKLIEVDVSNRSTKEFKAFYKQMIDYVENFLFQSEQYLFKEKTNKVNSFITSIYKQRFLSSYWSAMATLKGRKENLYKYLAEDLGTDIDLFDDEEFEEEILKIEVSDFELSPKGKEIIESEIRAINNVIKYGEEVEKNKNQINNLDPKISATIEIIEEKINKESFHPILIFSKYTSTLEALEQELFSKFKNLPIEFGMYSGNQIWYSLDGEKFKCKKEDIIQGLNNNLINILLCTEAASEGLNLQQARTLINIDVPWTPSVLEQRIGRIARLGQKADEVEIYLIWYPKSYEQKIYSKLIKKESDYHLAVGMYAQIIEDSIKAQTSDDDNSSKTLEYINKIRKNSEKIGLDKLFNLKLSELEPFGNSFRKGLMSIMESVGETTDNLSYDPNDFKVETVSLNNPNLLLSLKKLENTREITEFNATLFGLIYEDKLWGFVIFFQEKYYLLNPTHLIDVLLSITSNTQFSITDCIQVEESIPLSQLKEKYNKMNLPLTIPNHEKILFNSTNKFTDFELNNELKKLFSLNCSN